MSRWVVPNRPGLMSADANAEAPDNALGRITKYIPAEVLSAYTMLFTALTTMDVVDNQQIVAAFGLIAIFFIATIAYIMSQVAKGAIRRAHLIVSPVAFLAWAYPISSGILDSYYVPLIAFFGQVIAVVMSIFITPGE